jgi:IMP dehydrogenase
MKKYLSLDDVLILPQFSSIKSRKDVDTSVQVAGVTLKLPFISSNMDSVTNARLAQATHEVGAISCLHRFQSIESMVNEYKNSPSTTWVSIGLGEGELERAKALVSASAPIIVIDVAQGASMDVVKQVQALRQMYNNNIAIVVGNFATSLTIKDFNYHLGQYKVDAFKVFIGNGSGCLTSKVTGVGAPTFTTLQDCVSTGENIIADGSISNSGKFAKAIACGAKACMAGKLFAGTTESPGEIVEVNGHRYKHYRGSASLESYVAQGKVADHRTAEGGAYLVPHTGTVKETLQPYDAGLRSSMSYVGAINNQEFVERAEFVEITPQGYIETGLHGKKE